MLSAKVDTHLRMSHCLDNFNSVTIANTSNNRMFLLHHLLLISEKRNYKSWELTVCYVKQWLA